jgi:hypothetical protein
MTTFKGGENANFCLFFSLDYFTFVAFSVDLLTAVVDTDYYNWAVFVQCSQDGGENRLVPCLLLLQSRPMSNFWPNTVGCCLLR